uniref:Uncharacterized protein n=1 Tax=Manihot esculenta TaxID=3983 RepID=A0A2C9VNV4_MANES
MFISKNWSLTREMVDQEHDGDVGLAGNSSRARPTLID